MFSKIKLGLYKYLVRFYNFLPILASKVAYSLVSVKVWIIFSILSIATWLLVNKYISGTEWAGVVGGTISTIAAVREIYKTQTIKAPDGTITTSSETDDNDLSEKSENNGNMKDKIIKGVELMVDKASGK